MDVVSYLLGKKAGGGSPASLQEKSVTINSNGESSVTPDSGYDGLSKVNVTTNVLPNLESKSQTITTNTTTTITPSQGKDGLSSVEIITNIPQPSGTINITQNGTTDVTNYATAEVNVSAPTEPEEKDVNFYNYDGTRLYSYTKNEFLALDSMPANPVNEGMTSQGWNWDYQEAIDYVTEYGILDVGETCITSDGKSRVYISIPNDKFWLYFGIAVNGTVEIDWGDNTQHDTVTAAGIGDNRNTRHTYQTAGNYVITFWGLNDAPMAINGQMYQGSYLIHGNYGQAQKDQMFRNVIKKIELGRNIQPRSNSLWGLQNLESINLPINSSSYYYTDTGSFYNCFKLKKVIYPKGVHDIYFSGNSNNTVNVIFPSNLNSFNPNQSSIQGNRLIIPDGITGSSSLTVSLDNVYKLIVPKSITNMGNGIYGNGMQVLDFTHFTSIPTLASYSYYNSYANNHFRIVVPDSLYEDWIATANWSNISSKIIKKSDYDAL